jgi:hypothetical protein
MDHALNRYGVVLEVALRVGVDYELALSAAGHLFGSVRISSSP